MNKPHTNRKFFKKDVILNTVGMLAFSLTVMAAHAQILIGQSIALTGGTSQLGQEVVKGAKLHFDQINRAGGIAGQQIQLMSLDDGGKADTAAENIRTLLKKDQVVAIFAGIEGDPCTSMLKVAVEHKTPFVACMTGSAAMREPHEDYVFTVRAPHQAEFDSMIDMASSQGMTRFGFLQSESDNGRRHLSNVNRLLAAKKLPPARAFVLSKGVSSKSIVKELLRSDVQVMMNHGSYDMYADIILEARQLAPNRLNFYAVNSGMAQLVNKLGLASHGVTFTSIVPFPLSGREAISREFRKHFSAAYPDETPTLGAMEGYISAKVLTAGLSRAGNKVTRASLTRALSTLGRIDLGGFPITFTPGNYLGSTYVNTAMVNKEGRFVH
jgi:branched-chain amino acid transport system substrate-binding protein